MVPHTVAPPSHIAQALPMARLVVLPDCGHFAYLECLDAVAQALASFFGTP